MPSLLQTVVLFALVALALAVPAPAPAYAHIQKRSFKVERVPNPKFVRRPGAGTRALIKAHRKYSVPLPPGLLDALRNNGMGGQAAQGAAPDTNTAAAGDATTDGLLADLESALQGLGDGQGQQGNDNGGGANQGQSGGNSKGQGQGAQGQGQGGAGDAGAGKGSGAGAGTGNAQPTASAKPAAGAKNATGQTGLVAANPEAQDVEYLSPVNIGGQVLNMDFDSGSSDLWVFNTQLAAASKKGHTNFDPKKSASFKMIKGASFNISYGDGSGAAGNVGTDKVDIGGATATGQAIELATSVSQSFVEDQNSNGLVGLAFSELNTVQPQPQKTFFDNVMPSLAEPVFTADLRHNAAGSYEFGKIDNAKFKGQLSWAAVNTSQGFWQFSSEKFAVGNGKQMKVAGGQAIADTGTTLMMVDSAVVNAYYSQVAGATNDKQAGGVTFPCNSKLPDLNVDVGGNMAVVKGSDINFAPVDQKNKTCFGGVQAIAGPLQIYGDVMFKSQFVAFNGGNNSIGMAPHQ